MSFGLSGNDLNYIISVLSKFKEVKRTMIFGSRAKGNYNPGSDVELAVVGENITHDTIAKLHKVLEDESPMSYLFDIVDYSHLPNGKKKEYIDGVGINIYFRALN